MAKKELDKLALDVVECEKAGFGCHYGAWKATQQPAEPAQRKTDKKTGVCVWCGKTFIQTHSNKKMYCDDYCKVEAGKERERKRALERKGANIG